MRRFAQLENRIPKKNFKSLPIFLKMKKEYLIDYLKEQIEKAKKSKQNYNKSAETVAYYEGLIMAYEDALYQIKLPYLDE